MCRSPDKNNFVKNLEETFTRCNILEKQECYLLGDFNINLLHNGENIFEKKGHKSKLKSLPFLEKQYLDFGYSYSLQQLILVPTRIAENTAALFDHVLTNSPHKITQSGVIELNLSDHELIYCMRKTTRFKSNKHNELNIRSMKKYTIENFVEHLNKIDFQNYKTYSCINMAYLDFITKLIDVVDSLCPTIKITVKGNTKPWFDSEVISTVYKRDACYIKFKLSGLEADKDILRATKQFLKTTIQKKKRKFFQGKLQENSKNSEELLKTLKSLGLNSKEAGQSKNFLKEDDVIQFEPKNANIFKSFYSKLAGNLVKKLPKPPPKVNSEKTKML